MGHAMGGFKQDEWRVSTEMDVCLKVREFMRMKYAVSEKTFTKRATDRRWHALNPAEAVDLLKKEYDKHSKVAKRQWVVQNAPELIEEYKKLLRQEGLLVRSGL